MMPGFKLTTPWLWVCSLNHLNRAPSHLKNGFFKWAVPGLFFSLFSSFQYTADSKQMFNKYINFCRWLDSSCRPLVSEATALPTESQPLPIIATSILSFAKFGIQWNLDGIYFRETTELGVHRLNSPKN